MIGYIGIEVIRVDKIAISISMTCLYDEQIVSPYVVFPNLFAFFFDVERQIR